MLNDCINTLHNAFNTTKIKKNNNKNKCSHFIFIELEYSIWHTPTIYGWHAV